MVAILGGVAGLCFAGLAGRAVSVLAITPDHFRASSAVFAAIAAWLAYRALKVATSWRADEGSTFRAMEGGIGGAFVGLLVAVLAFFSFGQTARTYFTHPLGWHTSDISMSRLTIVLVLLGFCAGFMLVLPTHRRR